jgi:hypothetical protein
MHYNLGIAVAFLSLRWLDMLAARVRLGMLMTLVKFKGWASRRCGPET